MIVRLALAGCFFAVMCSSALGESSYTYVGVSYDTTDFLEEDFSGYSFDISVGIDDNIFVFAEYKKLESDDAFSDFSFSSEKLEVSERFVGIGFHTPVSNSFDFVGSLSVIDSTVEFMGNKFSGDGNVIRAGFKGMASEKIELSVLANRSDVENFIETGNSSSVKYFFTPAIAAVLEYDKVDSLDVRSLGIQINLN